MRYYVSRSYKESILGLPGVSAGITWPHISVLPRLGQMQLAIAVNHYLQKNVVEIWDTPVNPKRLTNTYSRRKIFINFFGLG